MMIELASVLLRMTPSVAFSLLWTTIGLVCDCVRCKIVFSWQARVRLYLPSLVIGSVLNTRFLALS